MNQQRKYSLPESALPRPERDWQVVLGLEELLLPTVEDVVKAYSRLVAGLRLGKSGNLAILLRLCAARGAALAELSKDQNDNTN